VIPHAVSAVPREYHHRDSEIRIHCSTLQRQKLLTVCIPDKSIGVVSYRTYVYSHMDEDEDEDAADTFNNGFDDDDDDEYVYSHEAANVI